MWEKYKFSPTQTWKENNIHKASKISKPVPSISTIEESFQWISGIWNYAETITWQRSLSLYEGHHNYLWEDAKKKKKPNEKDIWKKRSIFFDLPYWSDLDVRHCIDVMHVEKNVSDSLIGTLLTIKGKTKDGLTCRQDLFDIGIRDQLHPIAKGSRAYLPPACHTMSTKEKRCFCHCLRNMKVPQGCSSNIKILVSINDLKLVVCECMYTWFWWCQKKNQTRLLLLQD